MAAKYNEDFKLNPKDIEFIEEGLRALLHNLSHEAMALAASTDVASRKASQDIDAKGKQINNLLGKLHDKKVFYSQVHRKEGVPLG